MNKNINSLSPYTILTEVFRLLEEQIGTSSWTVEKITLEEYNNSSVESE